MTIYRSWIHSPLIFEQSHCCLSMTGDAHVNRHGFNGRAVGHGLHALWTRCFVASAAVYIVFSVHMSFRINTYVSSWNFNQSSPVDYTIHNDIKQTELFHLKIEKKNINQNCNLYVTFKVEFITIYWTYETVSGSGLIAEPIEYRVPYQYLYTDIRTHSNIDKYMYLELRRRHE